MSAERWGTTNTPVIRDSGTGSRGTDTTPRLSAPTQESSIDTQICISEERQIRNLGSKRSSCDPGSWG